jgi:hypothetical protein
MPTLILDPPLTFRLLNQQEGRPKVEVLKPVTGERWLP